MLLHGCFSFGQLCKDGKASLDHLEADTVADAEVSWAAKSVTGHHQKILLLCPFGKSDGIPTGCFDK